MGFIADVRAALVAAEIESPAHETEQRSAKSTYVSFGGFSETENGRWRAIAEIRVEMGIAGIDDPEDAFAEYVEAVLAAALEYARGGGIRTDSAILGVAREDADAGSMVAIVAVLEN